MISNRPTTAATCPACTRKRCHPERSRSSGGAKDLSLISCRDYPPAKLKGPARKSGGLFWLWQVLIASWRSLRSSLKGRPVCKLFHTIGERWMGIYLLPFFGVER